MDENQNVYKEEAYELLAELESSLLELEDRPHDMELIGRVFRAMHTIKGSGAMFGFTSIAAFTHEVETIYDLVRSGKLTVTPELVNLSLAARDQIRLMLATSDGPGDGDQAEQSRIVHELSRLRPATAEPATPQAQAAIPAPEPPPRLGATGENATLTYRISFKPLPNLFQTGTNPILLLDELRTLGSCTVVAHTDPIPALDDINPESCYLSWEIILTTNQGENAIRDIFIFVEDLCELTVRAIDSGLELDDESAHRKIGEILVERGEITHDALVELLRSQKRIGEVLTTAQAISADALNAALAEQQHVKEARAKVQSETQTTTLRVDAVRLDALVNLVGELVTVQARLTQRAALSDDPDLLAIAEEVEHLTDELRDNTMSIRMMPIGGIFSKFRRLVRDLSRDLGKEVTMTTTGEETELDKTVIEKLNDPFVHLIRNSIDHGIEQPEVREAAGKPRQGRVHLAAIHSGDSVVIEISDDGAGLNRQALRQKAIDKGLISEHEEPSDQEIYQFLFLPGFSTAAQVTNVSGRGVGMDVVKRSIESLRGTIDISTVLGQGTTIRIRLPLTLAIIDALLVNIGEAGFILPLGAVEECIELSREMVSRAHGQHLINVRGHLVPYIPLRECFAIPGEPPAIEQIVITSLNDTRIGFVVDHVVGEHQTVIKSLGPMHRNVRGVSGATVLGDGSVALILDIPQLAHEATGGVL